VKLTFALTIAATALLALQAATAAELPSRQAQPAATAKKCQIDGQQGIILPSSEVCMRVSGFVNAQAAFGTVSGSRKIGAP
jgi:type IV secretory pathway TrbL component